MPPRCMYVRMYRTCKVNEFFGTNGHDRKLEKRLIWKIRYHTYGTKMCVSFGRAAVDFLPMLVMIHSERPLWKYLCPAIFRGLA